MSGHYRTRSSSHEIPSPNLAIRPVGPVILIAECTSGWILMSGVTGSGVIVRGLPEITATMASSSPASGPQGFIADRSARSGQPSPETCSSFRAQPRLSVWGIDRVCDAGRRPRRAVRPGGELRRPSHADCGWSKQGFSTGILSSNCPTNSAWARVTCRVFSRNISERRPKISPLRGAFSWRSGWSLIPTDPWLRSHSRPGSTVFDASTTRSQERIIARRRASASLRGEKPVDVSCGVVIATKGRVTAGR